MIVKRHQTPMAGEVVHIEITCEDLNDEIGVRYSNKCSEGCAEGMKMFFTPKLLGSTIHANVCAGRFEFVQKLSKEWWARKAASVLGWDESKIREQTDPVWAMKVHNANITKTWSSRGASGRSKSSTYRGPKCSVCEKPVGRGVDICNACQGGDIQTNVSNEDFEDFFKGLEE